MTRIATLFALLVTLPQAIAHAEPDGEASLSWQLRPVTLGNFVRIDGAAAAFNDRNGNVDIAVASTLGASYQLSRAWASVLRLGLVGNNAPGAALDGSSFANPLLGATHVRRMGDYRLGVFAGATLPIGTGNSRTHAAAGTARPADRAMFDVDDVAGIAGVDVAYCKWGFTAQGEATIVQSVRVRGDEGERLATRAAVGVHLGYLVGWHIAVGGDLHYEDTLTAALGVRLQFRVGAHSWIRPGVALLRGFGERGLDAPLLNAHTTAVMVDLPMTF
ncbi:MAG: hypothetical protein IT370_11205 [Deltaproteobacteria bacterium]|nr:hypothetical protein [Deltaproteobacteria bacterium]